MQMHDRCPDDPSMSLRECGALLDEIAAVLRRYVVLTPAQTHMLAVWTAHTYVFDRFATTLYVAVTSPTLRAGKSRLLEVLELVVARPWRADSASPAALYRRIDATRPTLLLDEVDGTHMSGHL